MNRIAKISAVIALAVAGILPRAAAQEDYRFDIGAGIGMTGYLGDANTANLWSRPGWDAEILFRYILNPRWNFKTNFFVGSLSGDSSTMTNVFPNGASFKFSTLFYELGEMAEFHFFNYGMGETYRRLKRWTPYIAAGVSLTAWSVDGKPGATFTIPSERDSSSSPSLRWNIGLEFLMKKDIHRPHRRRAALRPLRHKKRVHEEYRLVLHVHDLYKLRIQQAVRRMPL